MALYLLLIPKGGRVESQLWAVNDHETGDGDPALLPVAFTTYMPVVPSAPSHTAIRNRIIPFLFECFGLIHLMTRIPTTPEHAA